jgi:hypothetical protein
MAEVPQSASDLFDVKLPEQLNKHPDKAREIGAIYAFKIGGDGGGEWTVDLASNPPAVVKGVLPTSQCTLVVDHADFKNMLSNPAVAMQLFMGGKLKVVGDPMLAMKLQKLFALS